MITKNEKLLGIAVVLLPMCCCLWMLAYPFEEPGPGEPGSVIAFSFQNSSLIDSNTLLQSVKQGDMSVFQFKTGLPDNYEFVTPVEWSQAQFMLVADALFQFVWKESWDTWKLRRMFFKANCKDNPSGYGEFDITFYQETLERATIVGRIYSYSLRTISINPEYGYVAWGEDTYTPDSSMLGWEVRKWKTVDLAEMKISADETLQIVEEKGGSDFRQSVENHCRISVDFWPDDRDAWNVDYWDNSSLSALHLWIPIE